VGLCVYRPRNFSFQPVLYHQHGRFEPRIHTSPDYACNKLARPLWCHIATRSFKFRFRIFISAAPLHKPCLAGGRLAQRGLGEKSACCFGFTGWSGPTRPSPASSNQKTSSLNNNTQHHRSPSSNHHHQRLRLLRGRHVHTVPSQNGGQVR